MAMTDSDLVKLDERQHSNNWGALKGVNLSTVIAVLSLLAGGFGAYYSLVSRAALQEAAMAQQKEFLMAQDAAIMAVVIRMSNQYDKVEAKLDRLIEMGGKR